MWKGPSAGEARGIEECLRLVGRRTDLLNPKPKNSTGSKKAEQRFCLLFLKTSDDDSNKF
jgi:hypothetical protein